VKTRDLADFARSLERVGGMGGRNDVLAESETYGGKPDAYLDRLELFATSTPADVKAAGNRWLRANHYTMTVRPAAKLAATKSTLDRKKLPSLGDAPDVKFPTLQRAQLKNGLKVVLLARHTAPIVNVSLAVDAGAASDTTAKAGAASLALDLLDKGTKGANARDAFALSDALENLGARLTTGTTQDQSLVRLQATSANLAPSLALMADAALNPSFPQDQFALSKSRRIAGIGQEKAQPNSLALRLVPAVLYGADHAYGKPASGFEGSVQSLTRDDLMAWHATWFKPGSATIVVAGDTTMDKLLPALEASFGKWQQGTAPAKKMAVVPPTRGKRLILVDKPDAPQSTIVATHVSQAYGQPEDLAMEPVMTNFGGMATSRLNRNLRLDKHWSYGTSARLLDVRGQRPFIIVAPVQTDKTIEAMREVEKELRGVAGERPLEGKEYESIMRGMTSRLPGRFSTLAALESAGLETVNLGLADDYWSKYASNVRALTPQQLAAASSKFIKPDEAVWMVIGDLRKIEAGVRSLGWGEVTVVDADGKPLR
jgi:zinc protease